MVGNKIAGFRVDAFSLKRRLWILLVLVISLIMVAPPEAQAQATYTYTGKPFNVSQCSTVYTADYGYPIQCVPGNLTASFTFSNSLAGYTGPIYPGNAQYRLISYTITSLGQTFNQSSAGTLLLANSFQVVNGQIVGWYIQLLVDSTGGYYGGEFLFYSFSPPACSATASLLGGCNLDFVQVLINGALTFGGNFGTPGTWSGGSSSPSAPPNNLGTSTNFIDSSAAPDSPANTATGSFADPNVQGTGCVTCDPIDTGTGNLLEAETDFLGAPSTGLRLTRYYNSQDTTQSAFGFGWHGTWHRGLSFNGSVVTVTRADGRQDVFTGNSSGTYVPNPNVTSTLVPVVSGSTLLGWNLTLPDDTVEFYGPNGNLTTITTRAGLVTRLTYNSSTNLLTSVTGPFGAVMSFAYDGNGHVAKMTAPDGGVYTYAYDSNKNLVSVKHPDTTIRQYVYENTSFVNALTGIIDEDGNRYATYAYDTQGRAISTQLAGGAGLETVAYNSNSSTVTDANGNAHTLGFTTNFGMVELSQVTGAPVPYTKGAAFAYDSNGFIASKADYDGNITTYIHDARGNEVSRTEAYGTPLARTYTATWSPVFHLPTQIVEPTGRTTTFAYDAHGNLLTKTVTAGTQTRIWRWTYNALGQILTSADPLGNVTTYAYNVQGNVVSITDALGHKTKFTAYDGAGRLLSAINPNGLVTTLTYDTLGRLLTSTAGAEVTSYDYDAAGNLIHAIRPDGSFYTYVYDAAHRLTHIADALNNQLGFVLDGDNNRVSASAFNPAGNLAQVRVFGYDNVDRLVQEVGAQSQTTNYRYDPQGNLTSASDPLNDTTQFAYDALNRRIQSTDALNGQTRYGYDALNRLTAESDPRNLTTGYGYDGLNDQTVIASPDTGNSGKTFDVAGNVLTSTDARGNTTVYSYDRLNRVTEARYADGTKSLYSYDQGTYGIGHLTSMNDPSGSTNWTYDQHGRVVEKVQRTGRAEFVTRMAYDSAGRLDSMQYPSGKTVDIAYDAAGHVSGLSANNKWLITSVVYRPFGPVASWQQGNGASHVRNFDLDGRITSIGMGGTLVSYGYDAANRVTGISETGYANENFSYDALNRLTGYSEGTVTNFTSYAYDANGNRLKLTDPNPLLTSVYGIAANNNWLVSETSGTGQEARSHAYSYDASGNLISDKVTEVDNAHHDAHDHHGDFDHSFADWDRDRLLHPASHTFFYNTRGRMASVETDDDSSNDNDRDHNQRRDDDHHGHITDYSINGLGERVGKFSRDNEGGATEYVYDEAGHLIGEYDGNGRVIEETVWLGDLPVAVMNGNGRDLDVHYINPDNIGAPHIITDAKNRNVWEWHHKPFGDSEPVEHDGFVYNLRFPGQIHDQESGLNYNMMRDYNPHLGRYVQSDPIGLVGGVNTFGYTEQNPLWASDPTGLCGLLQPTSNLQTAFVNWVDSNSTLQFIVNNPQYGQDLIWVGFTLVTLGGASEAEFSVWARAYANGGGGIGFDLADANVIRLDWHSFKLNGKIVSLPHIDIPGIVKHWPW